MTTWPDAFFHGGLRTVNGTPGSLVPAGPITGTFASPFGARGDKNNAGNPSANVNYAVSFQPIRPIA